MEYFGLTDRGKIRKDNQDCFLVQSNEKAKCLVAVLCDGMGGAKAGGLASDVASKAFVAYADERLSESGIRKPLYGNIVTDACAEANGVVYQYSCFDADYSGMGTTLVGAAVLKDRAYIVNVGDSRAYHITPDGIVRVSKDHSLVESMVDRGDITAEEARRHPNKNLITRALGPDTNANCDGYICPLRAGEYILLCTDGLVDTVTDQEMLFEVIHGDSPDTALERLLAISKGRGASDNVTAVLMQMQ